MNDDYLLLAAAEGGAPGCIASLLTTDSLPAELLAEPPGSTPPSARARCRDRDGLQRTVDRWRRDAERIEASILTPADALYPEHLRAAPLRPLVLFARGEPRLLSESRGAVTVVGSRTPTAYGRAAAQDFATALARDARVVLWSGLAAGIDAIAHRACLEAASPTVAVVAGGLDRIYPAQHHPLAESIIAAGGLVVSELPPGTAPRRGHFPRRNRILAAATGAVLVVEAGLASGTLHTARFAADTGTPVFAVPGPYTSPRSSGCHRLLADGAGIAADPESLLRELGVGTPQHTASAAHFRAFESSADARAILAQLAAGPRPSDLVQRESRLERGRFLAALFDLREHGVVMQLDGDLLARAGKGG